MKLRSALDLGLALICSIPLTVTAQTVDGRGVAPIAPFRANTLRLPEPNPAGLPGSLLLDPLMIRS